MMRVIVVAMMLSACATQKLEQRKINAEQCKVECDGTDGYAYVASYDICMCVGSKHTATFIPKQGVK